MNTGGPSGFHRSLRVPSGALASILRPPHSDAVVAGCGVVELSAAASAADQHNLCHVHCPRTCTAGQAVLNSSHGLRCHTSNGILFTPCPVFVWATSQTQPLHTECKHGVGRRARLSRLVAQPNTVLDSKSWSLHVRTMVHTARRTCASALISAW